MKGILIPLIFVFIISTPFQTSEVKFDNNYENEIMDCLIKPADVNPNEYLIETYSNDTVTYDTYMEAYYRALKTNMGENQKGSCGYVALGELLSYYDSYLNDSIIPEQYDVASTGSGTNMITRAVSPGILNDRVTYSEYSVYADSIDDLSATDYYTIMSNKATVSLHAKLITIGKSLGYYNFNDDSNPCSTNYSKRENILKNYLTSIGITSNLYSIKTYSSNNSNNVKSFIEENIDKGNPVLTSVYNSGDSLGHAVICYDYDDNYIYCNMGWSGSLTYAHYPVENLFNTYRNAMVIEFNYTHSHPLNYEVTSNGSTTKYCYCNCSILTYKEKTHDFTEYYVDSKDGLNHKSYCSCGTYILENHSWASNISPFASTLPYECTCKQCGAIKSSSSGGTGSF